MRTDLRRTVTLKRQDGKEQLEVGKLVENSFIKFKGEKGLKKKKIGIFLLPSQEVRKYF